VGLSPEQVRQNTNAFVKVRGRWRAKAYDKIPRPMVIYEKSRKTVAEVADSRTASLIGKYHSIIKQFLRTGKSSVLKRLPRTRFKDIKGRVHSLETRPRSILNIKAKEAEPEFFEIYRWHD